MFGEDSVDFSDEKNISVTIDGKTIHICLETRVRWKTLYVGVDFFFFVSLSECFRLPLPQSVSVLRGRMHRGRLPQRDGGSGGAAALRCPQPGHLSAGGRPDEHLEVMKENHCIS